MRITCFVLLLIFAITPLASAVDAVDRIGEAREVFEDVMSIKENSIPREILDKAHCLVIVPAAKKAGFGIGGQYGVGVAMCRRPDHVGWTGPSTVKMEGGSFGAQIGAGATDIVMMVMNSTGANRLMKSRFTIGGEGSAIAGPVGRVATAETDTYFRAEILSYSRARGLFAGAVIKGSTLRPADDSNERIYGYKIRHGDILHGRCPIPVIAQPLVNTVTRYSETED